MHTKELDKIIYQCQLQDRSAQFKLYKKYEKGMYNICLRMMNDATSAEDVLQVAFMKVFGNIDSYKRDATIGAWIKRIVINTCLSELNKKKIDFISMDNIDVKVEQGDDSETSYDVRKIKKAISLLPDGYRAIFNMYALEGYDHEEISKVLGISVGTSKSQYSRAKVKLKNLMCEGETSSLSSAG